VGRRVAAPPTTKNGKGLCESGEVLIVPRRSGGTIVSRVGILGLHGVLVFSNPEAKGVKERVRANDRDEGTLITDFRPEKRIVAEVKPRGAVGIGYGFDRLVGKGIVGAVDQLAVRSPGLHGATRHVLEGLNAIQHMTDILKVDVAVVPAEEKSVAVVRGVANAKSSVEALVLTRRQKYMINVTVAGLPSGRSYRVNHGSNVVIDQRSCGGNVVDGRALAHGVAMVVE